VRVASVPELTVCTKPSDQVRLNGAVPVRFALIVVDPPLQIVAPPLTVAVGVALTLTMVLPIERPEQFASLSVETKYVVVLDGETLRDAIVPLLTVCTKPSDQVRLNGAVPVRFALIVVDPPAQMVALPLIDAVGVGFTLTTALPDDVPAQLASLSVVIVYVVVLDGETLRDASVPLLIVCTKPSDQVMLNGAVPVRVALIVADPPLQIVPPPLTAAVGAGFTVTTALPDAVPVQFASLSVVTVYVVVLAGFTLRVASVPELTVCTKPSDQVMLNGAVPVRFALIVVDPPAQIAFEPLTLAVGSGFTVTTALPDGVPEQFASLNDVMV